MLYFLNPERIVVVADIVEAVASHRPCRASLGIEFALNEMRAEKGKALDADDSSLQQFTNNGSVMNEDTPDYPHD